MGHFPWLAMLNNQMVPISLPSIFDLFKWFVQLIILLKKIGEIPGSQDQDSTSSKPIISLNKSHSRPGKRLHNYGKFRRFEWVNQLYF